MPFDIERMQKLPQEARFFDINELWYYPNRWVVRFLYPFPITPTQITIASLVAGLISVLCYMVDSKTGLIWGALFLYVKIFLDNVDGNLARARGEVTRLGRFLDSLTDFIISFLVYFVLSSRLVDETGNSLYWLLGALALLSCLIHCSYFVFYLVQYTSIAGTYLCNRANEDISEEDNKAYDKGELSRLVYSLQYCHIFLYGWQDKAMEFLDRISKRWRFGRRLESFSEVDWYADKMFLTLISPLCLCTNNVLMVLFSLFDEIKVGFLFVIIGNFYLIGSQSWKIFKPRNKFSNQKDEGI